MQRVDHGLEFIGVIGLAFFVATGIAGRHVLPNQEPHPVTPVIPACTFVLDVLARHVHAELLGHGNVVLDGIIRGRRVQTIGPPALIQWAVLKEHLIVEFQSQHTVVVGRDLDLTHAKITGHRVRGLIILAKGDPQVVQSRHVRRPQPGLRNLQLDRLTGPTRLAGHDLALIHGLDFHGRSTIGLNRHGHQTAIHIRCNLDGFDMGPGHDLEPHGLPDACHGRVHDAAWFEHLFAVGLIAHVRGVPHGQHEFIVTVGHILGHVETEGIVAASVVAHLFAIDPQGTLPVHSTEVQEHAFACLPVRRVKGATIPEPLLRQDSLLHPAQGGLHGKRHQDLTVPVLRLVRVLGHNRIVPQPIEIGPVGPDHLRTRILRPHMIG